MDNTLKKSLARLKGRSRAFLGVAVLSLMVITSALAFWDAFNNVKATTLLPEADLVITDIDWSPYEPYEEQVVTFQATIENQGYADAGGFTVGLYIDGELNDTYEISSLAMGATATASFYWTATGVGDHAVQIYADIYDTVDESNEGNNDMIDTITVVSKPELAISSGDITFSDSAPPEGVEITIYATVHNFGGGYAQSVIVEFHVDDDNIGYDTINIAGNSQTTASQTWTTEGIGNHTVTVIVDPNNDFDEENESNNQASKILEVSDKPDLEITEDEISYSSERDPEDPIEGDLVTITAVFRNEGATDADGFYVALYIDNQFEEWQYVAGLESGSSDDVIFYWDSEGEAGNHLIKIYVDDNDDVDESDEGNNYAVIQMHVDTKPDLTLGSSDISWDPKHPTIEEDIIFSATIYNNGEANASNVRVILKSMDESGQPIVGTKFVNVTGQSFVTVVFEPYSFSEPGTYTMRVHVDPDNYIEESNENNNWAERDVEVRSKPDLEITESDIDPSDWTPTEGDVISIYVTVHNNGDGDADDFWVEFSIDDVRQETKMMSVNGNSDGMITFNWDTTGYGGEQHNLKFYADYNDTYEEGDEANNWAYITIEPSEKPDLVVTVSDITLQYNNDDNEPVEGVDVTITVIIHNRGGEDAGAPDDEFGVSLTIDDDTNPYAIETTWVPKKSTSEVEFTWTADTSGNHTFRIKADHEDSVDEIDENNNYANRTVYFKTKPDLSIADEDIEFNPEDPVEMDVVYIKAKIYNLGEADAKDFRVEFFVNNENEGYDDITIAGNSYGYAQISWVPQHEDVGNNSVRVEVDTHEEIDESNEANNIGYSYIVVVSLPDLKVTTSAITYAPDEPLQGEEVTIWVNVSNLGDTEAEDFDVALVVDNEELDRKPLSLDPHSTAQVTFTWDTSDYEGDVDVEINVDPDDYILEYDEGNNIAERTIHVKTKPNLVIEHDDIVFIWPGEEPVEGDDITIKVYFNNTGETRAEGFSVKVYIDNVPTFNATGINLDGETMTYRSWTWTGVKGDHNFRVVLDEENVVDEGPGNEGDNEASVDFRVLERPDLEITDADISFSDDTPGDGQLLKIYINITNLGEAKALRFKVKLYIHNQTGTDEYEYTDYIQNMNVDGESTNSTYFVWEAVLGNHTVTITVDWNDKINESDETNNEATKDIPEVTLKPDLWTRTNDITWQPDEPLEGEDLTIYVNVTNDEEIYAEQFRIAFYLDDPETGYQDDVLIDGLNPDETIQVVFIWGDIERGTHAIIIKVDWNNDVDENDETNNIAWNNVTVDQKPDLTLTSSDIEITDYEEYPTGNPIEGEEIKITVTIRNDGDRDAENFNVLIYIDDEEIANLSVDKVIAHDTTNKYVYWTCEKGDHTIKVVLDIFDVIDEGDYEDNNEAEKDFTVWEKADLEIKTSDITFSNDEPVEDDTITIYVNIKNKGEAPAKDFVVALFIDDNFEDDYTVTQLLGGYSTQVSFTWDVLVGEHTIKIWVDYELDINESDENNNIAEKDIYGMIPADFEIKKNEIEFIDWVVDGDDVQFTIKVYNNGEEDAENVKIGFYVDDTLQSGLTKTVGIDGGTFKEVTFTWSAESDSDRLRQIKIWADYDDKFDREYIETDNYATVNIHVIYKADLWLTAGDIEITDSDGDDITVNMDQGARKNQNIWVNVTIWNGNDDRDENVTSNFWNRLVVSGTTIELTKQVTQIVYSGGFVIISFGPFSLDETGSFTLTITVDINDNIDELDENNNIAERTFYVHDVADLAFDEGITVSDTNPTDGDNITVTVVIENNGDIDATSFYVAFYVDNNKESETFVGGLAKGGKKLLTFYWTAVEGEHTLKVLIDPTSESLPYGMVEEYDEDNNEDTYDIDVKKKADLAVLPGEITFEPAEPKDGDEVTVKVTIHNFGETTASGFTVELWVDDEQVGVETGITVSANGKKDITFTWDSKDRSGNHTFKIVVDSQNDIDEYDETNNMAEKTLYVKTKPDLTLTSKDIILSDESPTVGEEITISVKVWNLGETPAGNFSVDLIVNEVRQHTEMVADTIDAGSYYPVSFTWTPGDDGAIKIAVRVDAFNKIEEHNENNNEANRTVTVNPKPDLWITSADLSLSIDEPVEGSDVTVIVNINAKDFTELLSFAVTFKLDNKEIETKIIDSSYSTVTFLWENAKAGTHTVEIELDVDKEIAEANENNNEAKKNFKIYSKPDVTVEDDDIVFSDDKPTEGETITITVTVTNNGDTEAINVSVTFYVDNNLIGSALIPSIPGIETKFILLIPGIETGRSYTQDVSISWTPTESGRHTVKVKLTCENEKNITDNEMETDITILTKPDLTITTDDIIFDNEEPTEGDEVVITYTIYNDGETDAKNILVQIIDVVDGKEKILKNETIGMIKGGKSEDRTYTWTATKGKHTIKIVIDPLNSIDEGDFEGNNEAEKNINVKSKKKAPAFEIVLALTAILTVTAIIVLRRRV